MADRVAKCRARATVVVKPVSKHLLSSAALLFLERAGQIIEFQRRRLCCFATFSTAETAALAVARLNGELLGGAPVLVELLSNEELGSAAVARVRLVASVSVAGLGGEPAGESAAEPAAPVDEAPPLGGTVAGTAGEPGLPHHPTPPEPTFAAAAAATTLAFAPRRASTRTPSFPPPPTGSPPPSPSQPSPIKAASAMDGDADGRSPRFTGRYLVELLRLSGSCLGPALGSACSSSGDNIEGATSSPLPCTNSSRSSSGSSSRSSSSSSSSRSAQNPQQRHHHHHHRQHHQQQQALMRVLTGKRRCQAKEVCESFAATRALFDFDRKHGLGLRGNGGGGSGKRVCVFVPGDGCRPYTACALLLQAPRSWVA